MKVNYGFIVGGIVYKEDYRDYVCSLPTWQYFVNDEVDDNRIDYCEDTMYPLSKGQANFLDKYFSDASVGYDLRDGKAYGLAKEYTYNQVYTKLRYAWSNEDEDEWSEFWAD